MLNQNPTYFSDWLSKTAFAHDELSLEFSENRFPVKDKVTTKMPMSGLNAKPSNKAAECPIKDRSHNIWNCNKFNSLKVAE